MAHIIINPSLSATIAYNLFFNPSKFAEVSGILEPANSTRTDYSSCGNILSLLTKLLKIRGPQKLSQLTKELDTKYCVRNFELCTLKKANNSLT